MLKKNWKGIEFRRQNRVMGLTRNPTTASYVFSLVATFSSVPLAHYLIEYLLLNPPSRLRAKSAAAKQAVRRPRRSLGKGGPRRIMSTRHLRATRTRRRPPVRSVRLSSVRLSSRPKPNHSLVSRFANAIRALASRHCSQPVGACEQ